MKDDDVDVEIGVVSTRSLPRNVIDIIIFCITLCRRPTRPPRPTEPRRRRPHMVVVVWTTTSVRRPHIDDMVDARACVGTSSPITFHFHFRFGRQPNPKPKTIRRCEISLFNMDVWMESRTVHRVPRIRPSVRPPSLGHVDHHAMTQNMTVYYIRDRYMTIYEPRVCVCMRGVSSLFRTKMNLKFNSDDRRERDDGYAWTTTTTVVDGDHRPGRRWC
jgi:hypothetical protein